LAPDSRKAKHRRDTVYDGSPLPLGYGAGISGKRNCDQKKGITTMSADFSKRTAGDLTTEETVMEYIIIYNPTLRIVGPFPDCERAAEWGRQWQESHGDNPCWNTIELHGAPIARIVVEVERPTS
jgi:hypothetical protein